VWQRLIDRLGEDGVYRTDQDGTIEFITDGETLWVEADS
jgi:beta-lactamase superfamily II metal-dependent hydrolase